MSWRWLTVVGDIGDAVVGWWMRNADSDGFTRLSMNSVDIEESRKISVRSKFVIMLIGQVFTCKNRVVS